MNTCKKNLLFILLFICISSAPLLSQEFLPLQAESDSLQIIDIIISGNTKTKEQIILREMKTAIGDEFDPERLNEDRERIQNLQLFTRVEIVPDFTAQGIILNIIVAERWYVFPYPILYINDRDWSKVSYSAGIIHQNFRGLSHNIIAAFWLGYDPGIQFTYINPWFGGKHQFNYQVSAYSYQIRNKSSYLDDFNEKHRAASVTLGKRWGYHIYASSTLAYRQVTVPLQYKAVTHSGNATDHLPSARFAFRYDRRDLYEYPKKGGLFDLYVSHYRYKTEINYYRYGADVRLYHPVYKQVSLAYRVMCDLAHNRVPVYDRIFIGYGTRVRGEFFTISEGDNRFLGSVELRFPLIKIRYYDLSPITGDLGHYSSNLPFGLSGGLFYDTGAAWLRGEKLTGAILLSGFGAGLHLHLPYIQVLRLECAFNSDYQAQFIADMGVAF